MKVKPLHDWAVIAPSEAEARTAGGLFIPDTAKERPADGVVEAIGPGALEEEGYGKKKKEKKDRKFIATTVKPGDRVLYEEYAGRKVVVGNAEIVLVRERDILGILPLKPAQPKEDLPPLQIPAVTSVSGRTALAKRSSQTAVVKTETKRAPGTRGQGPGKATKKTTKKTAKITTKKAAAKKGPGAKGKAPGKPKKKK